jgi:hypothetical protein
MSPSRGARIALLALTLSIGAAQAASAEEQYDPVAWSIEAARGAFDLCRSDAPDAERVAEHGEVWGWPRFVGYLDHPKGYQREAGGESRREFTYGDKTAFVQLGVQSGQVVSAAPAVIRYFRCNVAVDQAVDSSLESYFTGLYGPPISKTDDATVWLTGEAGAAVGPDQAVSDDAVVKALVTAPPGAKVTRVELSRELGLDRAKLTILENAGGPGA